MKFQKAGTGLPALIPGSADLTKPKPKPKVDPNNKYVFLKKWEKTPFFVALKQ